MRAGDKFSAFVLDASVTLCWCFQDEEAVLANDVFAQLQGGAEALVPAVWWFEVRNAATLGVRKNRLNEQGLDAFFERLSQMIILVAEFPDTKIVFSLAQRHRLTFYDAAYLELAQREGVALATLDKALGRAATAEHIALLGA
jgi:predicted nucleic acid-binding protein